MKITILIADDHSIVRQGLRLLLSAEPDFEVIAEAEDGRTAVRLVKELNPDIVIMDVSMPILNGIDATRQIMAFSPKVKVLGLSMHSDKVFVLNMLKAGASGYLLKDSALEELKRAIGKIMKQEIYLSPGLFGLDINSWIINDTLFPIGLPIDSLSADERKVFQMLYDGNSIEEVAETLCMSKEKLDFIIVGLMPKFGPGPRTKPTKLPIRQGPAAPEIGSTNNKKKDNNIIEEGVSNLDDNYLKSMDEFLKFRDIFSAAMHNLRNIMLSVRVRVNDFQEKLADKNIEISKSKTFCSFINNRILEINHVLERLYYYLDVKGPSVELIKTDKILLLFDDFFGNIDSPNIKFIININDDFKGVELYIDEYQLIWVLEEIIYNSVKSLKDKNGVIAIDFYKNNENIAISIKDNGPGIPANIRRNLFKKQLSRTSTGLGIGLFLANKILKNMGGKLQLKTFLGKGTKTIILLPIPCQSN